MRRYVIAALAVAAALALNLLLVPLSLSSRAAWRRLHASTYLRAANPSVPRSSPRRLLPRVRGPERRSSDIGPAGGGRTLSLERRLRFEPGRVVLVTSENDALVAR